MILPTKDDSGVPALLQNRPDSEVSLAAVTG